MAENNLWTALVTGLVSVGVSAGSFVFVLRGQSKKIETQDKRIKEFDEKKLDKEKYNDLQAINNLEIKEHFREELTTFKNEIFPLIRNLQPVKKDEN